ncbi:serine hydrolase domain-containing protein [Kordiimonas gwangyangensis]|uniref:serine hydrolase domain-containing protein n=1 Tax=Kordiimonas gwangyangensis TaxID=288022 RepID=UPI000374A56E|nr:serine hydrolase domain-containing protein [Kordiimonas gwangyangensis]
MRLKLLLVAVMAFMSPAAHSSDQSWTDKAALDTFLEDAAAKGFVGVVGVSGPDGTIYARAFGDAVAGKAPYTLDTVVDIASISKQFTGAAIMKLHEAGKVDLQAPISRYLEDVPADKAAITVHQLLTHTAGMPDVIGPDEEAITKEAYLARAYAAPLLFSPGTRYEYSNVGYSLLAVIIEATSGLAYETYLYENLWKPAGMEQTGYYRPDYSGRTFPRVAEGVDGLFGSDELYARTAGNTWHLYGNGGVLSTLEDMLRWHRALLGDEILSAQSKALMFTPHVPEDDEGVYHYGYGWSVVPDFGGRKLVWHNGGGYFTRADFWRFPEDGTAFFLATHTDDVPAYKIADGLSQIMLGRTPKPVTP